MIILDIMYVTPAPLAVIAVIGVNCEITERLDAKWSEKGESFIDSYVFHFPLEFQRIPNIPVPMKNLNF